MAVFAGPANVGNYVTRTYILSNTNGAETAAAATGQGKNYGLIAMFTIR